MGNPPADTAPPSRSLGCAPRGLKPCHRQDAVGAGLHCQLLRFRLWAGFTPTATARAINEAQRMLCSILHIAVVR